LLSWPGALDGEAAALSLARLELHKIMEASLIYLNTICHTIRRDTQSSTPIYTCTSTRAYSPSPPKAF
jgi:hypothetical protein